MSISNQFLTAWLITMFKGFCLRAINPATLKNISLCRNCNITYLTLWWGALCMTLSIREQETLNRQFVLKMMFMTWGSSECPDIADYEFWYQGSTQSSRSGKNLVRRSRFECRFQVYPNRPSESFQVHTLMWVSSFWNNYIIKYATKLQIRVVCSTSSLGLYLMVNEQR